MVKNFLIYFGVAQLLILPLSALWGVFGQRQISKIEGKANRESFSRYFFGALGVLEFVTFALILQGVWK